METLKKITIEGLNSDTVVVLTRTFVNVDGQELQLGTTNSICYNNCPYDREQMQKNLPEKYANAILTIWGNKPTLDDPIKG